MENSHLVVETFYFNPYRECTYIITNGCPLEGKPTEGAVIIDPGMSTDKEQARLQAYLDAHNLTPVAVLITHAHPDHVCGVEYLQNRYAELPIYGKDRQVCNTSLPERLNLLGLSIQVIPTPGHREDAVCFYLESEQTVFTGDTLFQESIGRTDLPGGDMGQLIHSLQILSALHPDTKVYPGHGYTTTIAHEKEFNPYM